MLFCAGLLPSPSSISHYDYPHEKTLRICANSMTQHGRGMVGTCPPAPGFAGVMLYCEDVFSIPAQGMGEHVGGPVKAKKNPSG